MIHRREDSEFEQKKSSSSGIETPVSQETIQVLLNRATSFACKERDSGDKSAVFPADDSAWRSELLKRSTTDLQTLATEIAREDGYRRSIRHNAKLEKMREHHTQEDQFRATEHVRWAQTVDRAATRVRRAASAWLNRVQDPDYHRSFYDVSHSSAPRHLFPNAPYGMEVPSYMAEAATKQARRYAPWASHEDEPARTRHVHGRLPPKEKWGTPSFLSASSTAGGHSHHSHDSLPHSHAGHHHSSSSNGISMWNSAGAGHSAEVGGPVAKQLFADG